MRINYLLIMMMSTVFINAQSLYSENFENGVPGTMIQKFQNGKTSWINFGISAVYVDKPLSGGNSAVFINGMATNEVVTTLETPVLDLSSNNLKLEFKHFQKKRNIDYVNRLIVELSIDAGENWIEIGDYSKTSKNTIEENISLTGFKLSKNSIIRFKAIQLTVDTGFPIVLDDIAIVKFFDTNDKIEASENDIQIFPNPSQGIFNIITKTPSNISIYDQKSNLIKSFRQTLNESIIDLSSQIKGLYIIKIQDKNNEETKKIILN